MNDRLHFPGTLQPLAADPVFVSSWVGPRVKWGAWKKILTSCPVSRFLNFVQHFTLYGNFPHKNLTTQSIKNIKKKTPLEKILKEVTFSLETEINFSIRGYIAFPLPPPPKKKRTASAKIVSVKVLARDIFVLIFTKNLRVDARTRESERDVSYIPDVVPSYDGVTTFTC
jgi:hypothetical protein